MCATERFERRAGDGHGVLEGLEAYIVFEKAPLMAVRLGSLSGSEYMLGRCSRSDDELLDIFSFFDASPILAESERVQCPSVAYYRLSTYIFN